ncbi:MAG: hypothetical protein H0W06_06845 [Chloroflexia bacterium]|nr:hypothetical protein [Chloroflexia bacterium]
MNWLERHLGVALVGAGIIHTLFGLTMYDRSVPVALWRDGLLNSVGPSGKRSEWLWFTTAGGLLIGTGLLARRHFRRTGTLPAAFGASLLATALDDGVLQPASGVWLVAAEGFVALRIAARRPIGTSFAARSSGGASIASTA